MESDWSRRVQFLLYCTIGLNIVLFHKKKQQYSNSMVRKTRNLLIKKKKKKKNSSKSLLLIKNYLYTNEIVTIDKELIKNKNLFFWVFLIPLINNELVNGRYLVH